MLRDFEWLGYFVVFQGWGTLRFIMAGVLSEFMSPGYFAISDGGEYFAISGRLEYLVISEGWGYVANFGSGRHLAISGGRGT